MMNLKTLLAATMLATLPLSAHAGEAKPTPAEIVANADISVGLNGLVCDFCSIALNKTFKKQDTVIATHVDLDTKTLSVDLKDGASMDNDRIIKLVKKAGYSVTKIARKDGSEFIPPSKS